MQSDSNCYAREKVEMDFDSCYNCGEQGHFASSCPQGVDLSKPAPRGNHPQQFKPVPARPPDQQAAINERGVALCRAVLAHQEGTTP